MLFYNRQCKVPSKSTLSGYTLIVSLLVLSGCSAFGTMSSVSSDSAQNFSSRQDDLDKRTAELNNRETELIARETAISARESELVTLFAELVKQKEQLEKQHTQLQNKTKQIKNASQSSTNTKTPIPTAGNAQSQSGKTSVSGTTSETAARDNRTILGGLEYVLLEPPGINLSARIDTGAQTSSLNALDMIEFERDGKPYIKFNIIDPETEEKIELIRRIRGYTKIKKHKTDSQRRPIVRLRVKLSDLDEHISFTLIDRSKFKQQVLIGRNFLRDLAIVDVSKEFTIQKTNSGTDKR